MTPRPTAGMSKTALKKKPRGLTLADVSLDFTPRCKGCGKAFLSSSPMKLRREAIVLYCQWSDCYDITVFSRRTA